MDLMLPDTGLLFWMTVIFGLVLFILAKFGFTLITGMVDKRNKRINDSLEVARTAEEAIAHLTQEKERILEETRQEQNRLMKEAAVERERVLEQAQTEAKEEAEKILQAATAKIQEEKEAAMKELRNEVAVISLAIAEKALRKELASENSQTELINRLVDQMSEQPS